MAIMLCGVQLGQAVIFPTHNSLIADYYPVESRPRVYSAHRAGLSLGIVSGVLLGAGLTAAFSVGGCPSWSSPSPSWSWFWSVSVCTSRPGAASRRPPCRQDRERPTRRWRRCQPGPQDAVEMPVPVRASTVVR